MRISDWSSDVCSPESEQHKDHHESEGALTGGGNLARRCRCKKQACRYNEQKAQHFDDGERILCARAEVDSDPVKSGNDQNDEGAVYRADRKSTRLNSSH